MGYNLCWSTGKAIERSFTESFDEAVTMAKIMSRGNENINSMAIIIVNDKSDPVEFIHNGDRFIKLNKE